LLERIRSSAELTQKAMKANFNVVVLSAEVTIGLRTAQISMQSF